LGEKIINLILSSSNKTHTVPIQKCTNKTE
jgi:hypothetical protein